MTIKEKAKEYAETCIDNRDSIFAIVARVEGRDGFKRGAEWMLSQVEELYKNERAMQLSFWSKFMNFKEMMKG